MRVRLEANAGGLKLSGTILLDQLLMVDASRLRGHYGKLTAKELIQVRKGLETLLSDS
jgi:mRNA-degrading endonuclease toxin of MazEF toxin-antitoxin module